MNEDFLHYIWQCQYFQKSNLTATTGESISVHKTGIHNTDAGPDFLNAKIKIADIEWAGHVEIHLKSSDWNQHSHQTDFAYNNVILHVVWKHDAEIKRIDGTLIPTLELRSRVDHALTKSYQRLMGSGFSIACAKSFPHDQAVVKLSMLDKALAQRLNAKATGILNLLSESKGDWSEVFYQTLAKNFGFKVNADIFFQLSRVVPYRLLQKQSGNLLQMEALLLGGAGMLNTKSKETYHADLFREYQLLKSKYSLGENQLHPSRWKFLRLRPANFPTLRIAQFASLLFRNQNIFSKILETSTIDDLSTIFDIEVSEYWRNHYRFGKKSNKLTGFGEASFFNVVINTIVPILAAYSIAKNEQSLMDRAVRLLEQLPSEKNKITRAWEQLGFNVKSAFDSQALIQQYNVMCQHKRCLDCVVGASLIKPTAE